MSIVTPQLRKRLQKKLLLVEIESDEDDYECGTEVGIQLEPKDEYWECRCHQHGTGDEEEPGDVAAVFDDRWHDEASDRLQHTNNGGLSH